MFYWKIRRIISVIYIQVFSRSSFFKKKNPPRHWDSRRNKGRVEGSPPQTSRLVTYPLPSPEVDPGYFYGGRKPGPHFLGGLKKIMGFPGAVIKGPYENAWVIGGGPPCSMIISFSGMGIPMERSSCFWLFSSWRVNLRYAHPLVAYREKTTKLGSWQTWRSKHLQGQRSSKKINKASRNSHSILRSCSRLNKMQVLRSRCDNPNLCDVRDILAAATKPLADIPLYILIGLWGSYRGLL